MKNKIVLLLCGVLLGSSALAQYKTRQSINELYLADAYIKRQADGISYNNPDEYNGTPYNFPDYQIGNIYKGNELFATEVALRYNAVADELEVKESLATSDEDARVLPKDPEIFVKIQNDIFVFVPFQGKVEDGGYFHVMYEGKKLDLYKKIIKKVIPGKKASNSLTKDVPTEFRDKSQYFLVTKNGRFYQLPDSKAKKFDIFGANKALVMKYVEENDLDVNNDEDLLKIVAYYDGV